MKGPTPEAVAKNRTRPINTSTTTIGIIHHIFARQKNPINAHAMESLPPISRSNCILACLTPNPSRSANKRVTDPASNNPEKPAFVTSSEQHPGLDQPRLRLVQDVVPQNKGINTGD